MTAYVLDAGPLGRICHPRKYEDAREWLRKALWAGDEIYVPEVADYELRRELLRIGATASLARLDDLARDATYLPLDTATRRDAAQLWADLCGKGKPVGAPEALGADAILAAQALRVSGTVVTTNPRHVARMVLTLAWPG
ncbi:MAG: PIN domain-containing protein [Polyangiales bacterium]